MSRTSEDMVRELHRVLGHPVNTVPHQINDERLLLRLRLISEEVTELLCAMTGQPKDRERVYKKLFKSLVESMFDSRDTANLVKVADGCVDSHVVISGTAIEFGIPEDAVYEEIHRTNLAKAGGPVRADGKVLKPDGWEPPNIKAILYPVKEKS